MPFLDDAYSLWIRVKIFFEFGGTLSPNYVHLYLGVIIFFTAWMFFRKKPYAHFKALFFLMALQTVNELLDYGFAVRADKVLLLRDVFYDFLYTLTVPILVAFSIQIRKDMKS